MAFDQHQIAPNGKTYAQIDAEQQEYVRAANAALVDLGNKDARWWSYSASHSTFEMLVGEPHTRNNIVLSLPACEYLAGPVQWSAQKIEVVFRCDRASADRAWEFEIRDEAVGFLAVSRVFGWCRGYDLWAQSGLWFRRGAGPATALSAEQAEESVARLLRNFYKGKMAYNDLASEISRVLDQLPVVSARVDVADEGE